MSPKRFAMIFVYFSFREKDTLYIYIIISLYKYLHKYMYVYIFKYAYILWLNSCMHTAEYFVDAFKYIFKFFVE